MPNNTGVAIILGGLTFVLGFALVWRIWWLCALSLLAIIALVIYRSFKGDPGYIITAAELEKMEKGAMHREAQVGKQRHQAGSGVLGEAIAYERSDLPPLASQPSSSVGLDHHRS